MADASIDTGDLWRWVDRLTQDRRQRVVRKAPGQKPRVEYFTVPALWTQLHREVDSSSAGGGHGAASAGSRSPLNLEKVALLIEITQAVADTLVQHKRTPRRLAETDAGRGRSAPAPRLVDDYGLPLLDPEQAGRLVERAARVAADARARRDVGRSLHDTSSDLRRLATIIVGTSDHDLITHWADEYRSWVARIETALGEDDESIDTRPVRDQACPNCDATHVVREQPSTATASGIETFHDPALVIQFRDGQVQHITCRACGTGWWRGDGIDQLTEQLLKAAGGDVDEPVPGDGEHGTISA